jgi:hypothetical protein
MTKAITIGTKLSATMKPIPKIPGALVIGYFFHPPRSLRKRRLKAK